MILLRFDEKALDSDLWRLTPSFRTIFAGSCAQRMAPYFALAESAIGAKAASFLNSIWIDISNQQLSKHELKTMVDSCVSSAVEMAEQGNIDVGDALAVLAYSVKCHQTSDPQDAIFAVSIAVNSFDQLAQEDLFELEPSDPNYETKLVSHFLVQNELIRQQQDMQELQKYCATSSTHVGAVAALFRQRAEKQGADPLLAKEIHKHAYERAWFKANLLCNKKNIAPAD